jgi:hypothetical protein
MESNTMEKIGVVSGGAAGTDAGIAGAIAAISAAGTRAGLSGPGIMTGLQAIGELALGGIALGITLVAGGTVLLAGEGAYAGYRFVKRLGKKNR